MKSVMGLWFLAASLAAQTASVEGTVVDKTTGRAIAGVHIRLIDFAGIDDQNIMSVYGAISDRAGHYSISDIKPGGYLVMLERTGYSNGWVGNSVPPLIGLKAGDHITDHKLELALEAHVSGRVVDENGDPVQGVTIQAMATSRNGGFGGTGNTDDRGEFRFAAAPGRYYLQATLAQMAGGSGEIRDGVTLGSAKATYYPSTASKDEASVVEMAAGQEASGLDIRLVREALSSGHLLTISGTVTGIPEHTSPMVTLRSGDTASTMYMSQSIGVGPGGGFSFKGLEPKYYRLTAQAGSGKTRMQSQDVNFHLNADQTGVQLNLQPGEELTGTLEITGGTLTGKKPSVYLESEYSFGDNSQSAAPDADGTFHFAGMFGGKYKLRIEPMPENAFLKTILLDGAKVEADSIDLSRGVKGAQLKVALSVNAGQLSGKILGHDGQPSASPMVMLMIWRDGKDNSDTEQVKGGEYKLKSLRPGKLRVLAVDFLDIAGLPDIDGDETEKLAKAAAEEVEIKEGDHLVKDLKVVDKEKLNVKK